MTGIRQIHDGQPAMAEGQIEALAPLVTEVRKPLCGVGIGPGALDDASRPGVDQDIALVVRAAMAEAANGIPQGV